MGPGAGGQNEFRIRLDATPGVDDVARGAIDGGHGAAEAALQPGVLQQCRIHGERLPAQFTGEEGRQARAVIGFAGLIAVHQARGRQAARQPRSTGMPIGPPPTMTMGGVAGSASGYSGRTAAKGDSSVVALLLTVQPLCHGSGTGSTR